MQYDLSEIVDRFCARHSYNFDTQTLQNFFNPDRRINSFLQNLPRTRFSDREKDVLIASVTESIRDTIKSYTKSKKTAIEIFQEFILFLRREYEINAVVEFPREAIWNATERQLTILKLLQPGELSDRQSEKTVISRLSDRLLVSERTIANDLAILKGKPEEPLSLLNQTVKVPFKSRNGEIDIDSTAHPLFLLPNLSQIGVLLKALEEQSRDPMYETTTHDLTSIIWSELSAYARNRILEVADIFELDREWLIKL